MPETSIATATHRPAPRELGPFGQTNRGPQKVIKFDIFEPRLEQASASHARSQGPSTTLGELTSKLETNIGLSISLLQESHRKLNKYLPENLNSANLLPY